MTDPRATHTQYFLFIFHPDKTDSLTHGPLLVPYLVRRLGYSTDESVTGTHHAVNWANHWIGVMATEYVGHPYEFTRDGEPWTPPESE